MEEKLEVLEIGYGAGHAHFALGKSTKLRGVDYIGKLLFHKVLLAQFVARVPNAVQCRRD